MDDLENLSPEESNEISNEARQFLLLAKVKALETALLEVCQKLGIKPGSGDMFQYILKLRDTALDNFLSSSSDISHDRASKIKRCIERWKKQGDQQK